MPDRISPKPDTLNSLRESANREAKEYLDRAERAESQLESARQCITQLTEQNDSYERIIDILTAALERAYGIKVENGKRVVPYAR